MADDKDKDKGTPPPADDKDKTIAELKAELEKLKAKPKPEDDPDLKEKARLQKESDDKKASETKQLEAALKFNLNSKEWLKNHSSLLPKDIEGIFAAADKETYDNAIQKDTALKSGIVQSFFSVQANLDLLTPALKNKFEEWSKKTKSSKQDSAQEIYDAIFEPAFEMLKRVKKAEALNGGFNNPDDIQTAYKDKMVKLSQKHYLGKEQ